MEVGIERFSAIFVYLIYERKKVFSCNICSLHMISITQTLLFQASFIKTSFLISMETL